MPTDNDFPRCPECKFPTRGLSTVCQYCGCDFTEGRAESDPGEQLGRDEPQAAAHPAPIFSPVAGGGARLVRDPRRDNRLIAVVGAVLLLFVLLGGWLFFLRGTDDASTTATAASGGAERDGATGTTGATGTQTLGTAVPYPGAWTYVGPDGVRSYVEVLSAVESDGFFGAFLTTSSEACSGRPAFAFAVAPQPDLITSSYRVLAACAPADHELVVPMRFAGSCEDGGCSVTDQASQIEWRLAEDGSRIVLAEVIDCLAAGRSCERTPGDSPISEMRFGSSAFRP